jgi:hypothetical protein
MADDLLLAQYPKQQHVRDRNFSGLVAWSASIKAQPIPADKPDLGWVRERVVAERIPMQVANYVERTIAFFMQDPATVTNIRKFLNPWNASATEEALSLQINAVIAPFMPGFAALDVSAAEVEAWYAQNGFAPDQPNEPGEGEEH